jgi:hypothetical protein
MTCIFPWSCTEPGNCILVLETNGVGERKQKEERGQRYYTYEVSHLFPGRNGPRAAMGRSIAKGCVALLFSIGWKAFRCWALYEWCDRSSEKGSTCATVRAS